MNPAAVNPAAGTTGTGQPEAVDDEQVMAQYGITRTTVDYFHVGAFRYTNFADATAAGKRQQQNPLPNVTRPAGG